MLTETLKSSQLKKDDVSFVIFLLSDKFSKSKLCGITMLDWVKKAINNFPTIEFDYSGEELVSFLKPRLVNSRYVIVLYSNTPLLTNASVLKIIEYVKFKEIKACKFNGGFAFDIEYLKSSNKVVFDSYLPLDNEDFLVVDNKSKEIVANSILKNRIIQKHIANGVEIYGDSEIDGQVEIAKNVKPYLQINHFLSKNKDKGE